ncbi:MAG: hypothetical protein OHK0057_27340 [Thermoflexibacter sp.]
MIGWFLVVLSSCQPEFNPSLNDTYIRYFGNSYNTTPVTFEVLDDGGFLLLGTEVTTSQQDSNMVLIRTDEFGHVKWRVSIGSTPHEVAKDMVFTSNQIMVLGQRYDQRRNADYYLAGVSWEGAVILEQVYGNEETDEKAAGITVQNDGSFVLLGHTNAIREDVEEYDLLSIKVDAFGVKQYERYYGLQGTSKTDIIDDYGVAIKSEPTNDVVWLGNIKRSTNANQSVRMVRVNPNSDIIKDEKYPTTQEEIATSLFPIIQGYFITGEFQTNNGSSIFVRFVDNALLSAWDRRVESGINEKAYSIAQNAERDLIIAGKSVNPETNNEDMLLLLLDADGKEKWRSYFGGSKPDRGIKALPLKDGGYALFGAVTFGNNVMMSLIKTDANGKLKS